jgi:hypothetical protein
MANPARGQVPLVAGETTYTLSLSINAICCIEEHFDQPIGEVAARLNLGESVRMGDVRALLWGALQDHHEGCTIKDAGRIATEAGIQSVVAAFGRLFEVAFPAVDDVSTEGNARKGRRAA